MTRTDVMELWEMGEQFAAHILASGFRDRQWVDRWLVDLADWCGERLREMEAR